VPDLSQGQELDGVAEGVPDGAAKQATQDPRMQEFLVPLPRETAHDGASVLVVVRECEVVALHVIALSAVSG
jgi:hypothetical protein